jgi:glycosyltransferase involved in cell wall biosynthesis
VIPSNVHVRFVRERASAIRNPFIAHIDSWLSYAAFNRLVLEAAEAWHREVGFDLCHQVTIAAWRMPSQLWRLPIPFVWGPIGGAGYIPPAFRGMLSLSSRLFERARDFQTALAGRSPAFRDCIRESAVVFAANEETEEFLRPFRGDKPLVRLPIASLPAEKVARFKRPESSSRSEGPLHLFAGGNMEGRKGVSLALKALAMVKEAGVDFHYTIGGGGPEIASLKTLAMRLGLEQHVTFHTGFGGDDYVRQLRSTDVYFLPSFRESTPVTLLEACLAECYPVVADTSAQGEIVRFAGGRAVSADNMDSLVRGLADAIIWCANHRDELRLLAAASVERIAEHFSSERYDATLEQAYEFAVKLKAGS